MHFATKKNYLVLYNCFLLIGGVMFLMGFLASGVRALDHDLGLLVGSPWNTMSIIGITGVSLVILAAFGRYRSKTISHFF